MIYHDILGVNIIASASQIEDAYQNHIDALKKSRFDIECPELYSRKVRELSNAKAECLAYIKEPFLKKAELETKECAARAFSPNVSYSCCCGDDKCWTCCTICFVTIAVIGFVSLFDWCKKQNEKAELRRQENERKQQTHVLYERRDRENEERIRLNSEMIDTKQMFEDARREHEELKTRLSEFESKITIINNFLHDNGVSADLKQSAAYVSLLQQTENALNEERRHENRIREIESELQQFEEHEIELQNFLNHRS